MQVFTEETKIAAAEAIACNRWQLSEKGYSKILGQILEKIDVRVFLVKLQAMSLQIYQKINSSTGIFQGKSYLFSSYLLCFRIPRTAGF